MNEHPDQGNGTGNQFSLCPPAFGQGMVGQLMLMNQLLMKSMGHDVNTLQGNLGNTNPFQGSHGSINPFQGNNPSAFRVDTPFVDNPMGTNQSQVVTEQPLATNQVNSNNSRPSANEVDELGEDGNLLSDTEVSQVSANISVRNQDHADDCRIPDIVMKPQANLNVSEEENDDEDLDETHQKLSSTFTHARIDPLLRSTAQLLGLEVLDNEDDDEVGQGALLYGCVGPLNDQNAPILKLPNVVAKLTKAERKLEEKAGKLKPHPPRVFSKVFRVSSEDFYKFFATSKLDEDLSNVLKREGGRKVGYSAEWDADLTFLDERIQVLKRLAAFQLTLLNALIVDLQPLEDVESGKEANDFDIPVAKLLADMSAQSLSLSIKTSHKITMIRRKNVCNGLRGKFVNRLVDDLAKVSLKDRDDQIPRLFSGKFQDTVKSVAKKEQSELAIEKVRSEGQGSSSKKGGGSGVGPQPSSYRPGRGGGRGNSRGLKRRAQDQDIGVGRGRGHAGYPPKRGRGRGRGRAQTRF